jgi:hypothetical protein
MYTNSTILVIFFLAFIQDLVLSWPDFKLFKKSDPFYVEPVDRFKIIKYFLQPLLVSVKGTF